MAVAEAVKMADVVMMHTDADRTDVNADAAAEAPTLVRATMLATSAAWKMFFIFCPFFLKPSRPKATPPSGNRCGRFQAQ